MSGKLFSEAYEPSPDYCVFPVVIDATGRMMYPCPDEYWQDHMKAWRRRRQNGETSIVEPFPAGHLMFERSRDYGVYPYGTTDAKIIRRAHRRYIIGTLDGWDRELRQSKAGMRQLAKIVQATVKARLAGQDLGGTPFVAALWAGMHV